MKTLITLSILGLAAGLGAVACSASDGSRIVISGWAPPPDGGAGGTNGFAGAGGTSGASGSGGTAGTSGSGGTSGAGGSAGASGGGAPGVPCNVSTALAACVTCHSDPPLSGALTGLVSYAELTKKSALAPTLSEAAESVALMGSGTPQMPPGGGASAANISTIQAWVTAGMPMGATCGGGADGGTGGGDGGTVTAPTDPFKGAPAFSCTTGPSTHNAGQNCLSCHNGSGGGGGGDDAPQFAWAGTLYDKTGTTAIAGAEVRLVDSMGNATSVCTGPEGTFFSGGSGFSAPAWVGVRNATLKENMLTSLAATGGGCSSCHGTSIVGQVGLY